MKKLYTFLAIMILCGYVQSQTFTMVDTMRTTYGSTASSSVTNPVQIINNSGASLNMTWDRFYENLPVGWDVSSCSPAGCAAIGISSDSYVLDTVNSLSDYHNCHFYPNGIAGTGEAKIRITNTTTMEEEIVTWVAIIGFDGIDEQLNATVTTYPNPGTEVTVKYDFKDLSLVNMVIMNMEGKVINSRLLNGTNSILLDQLESGLYLLKFTSTEGLNLTEKVIIH